jgi:hypothetical protein
MPIRVSRSYLWPPPRVGSARARSLTAPAARRKGTTSHGVQATAKVTQPKLIVNSTALGAAYFGWRHVIGQVLLNLEPNRRLVSANASD